MPYRQIIIRNLTFAEMNMLLSDYIEQALVKHDCAIVPGLGGFVVQRESACILEDKVLPPRSTVGFNPLLTHTDGQLATAIMRDKEIGYKEADALLNEWIAVWQRELETGNAVDMGKIGTLQRQPDGHIEFLPKEMYFLPDNLGLTPIFRHKKELDIPRKQSVLLTYSRYVAACAAFALLLFAPNNTPTTYVDYATLDPTIWTRKMVTAPAETVDTTFTDSLQITAATANPMTNEMQTETITHMEKEEVCKFHLIVAALDKNSAEKYCANLKKKGHEKAHVIPYKKGLYRIAIASYTQRKQAIEAMETLRNQDSCYAKAWVYCE